jgi:hypothetical protein
LVQHFAAWGGAFKDRHRRKLDGMPSFLKLDSEKILDNCSLNELSFDVDQKPEDKRLTLEATHVYKETIQIERLDAALPAASYGCVYC